SYSCVQRATLKVAGSEVPAVVKTMRVFDSDPDKLKDRLLRMKQELQHNNIVKILGLYWLEPKVMSVVMEPADRCLRRLLTEEPQ
ncbi:pats1, partial [Symbiodinium pilosum]